MRTFLVVCMACTLPLVVQGFAPMATLPKPRVAAVRQHMIPPEHMDALNVALDSFHHYSQQLTLADASAVAQDAVDAAKDEGWWQQYLNIFKATLIFIHSTIDGPLRSQGITQTWGISIALFTVSLRSLLIPLSIQQNKGMEYQKALKPYMKDIKEKFKDNKDAQNRAMAKLFEDANQNPLSGCFLSLAQLPVLLGLYRGIRNLAQDGVLKEPFLWIPSLEGPVSPPNFNGLDWLTAGWETIDGIPTPQLGWETTLAFLIMPVVLVLGQSITMNVMSPPVDAENMTPEEANAAESTKGVLKFLPLLIGYFSLQVPAGLTIYWFTTNLFTLSQSLAIKAYYRANPPVIDLPEFWSSLDKDLDSMSPDEKRAAAEAGISMAPAFASLIEAANFHYVVPRNPLREDSEAWARVLASGGSIPPEMKEWVENDNAVPFYMEEQEPIAKSA